MLSHFLTTGAEFNELGGHIIVSEIRKSPNFATRTVQTSASIVTFLFQSHEYLNRLIAISVLQALLFGTNMSTEDRLYISNIVII